MQYHGSVVISPKPMHMSLSANVTAAIRSGLTALVLATTSHAGITVETLQKGCRGLLSGGRSAATAEATCSISAWIKTVPDSGSGGTATKDDPTKTLFKEAENPVWCAAGIEKFILANREAIPVGTLDTELLPLWWISIHPAANAEQKAWVQARLRELKGQKLASASGGVDRAGN